MTLGGPVYPKIGSAPDGFVMYEKPPVPKVRAWSYSTLTLWEQCPLRYRLEKLDKVPVPPAPALERGIAVHAKAERYLKGEIKKLPAELEKLSEHYLAARTLPKKDVEREYAFTQGWKPTGWMSPNVWLRVKVDLGWTEGDVRFNVDHKTGKVREKNRDQLRLYGLTGLLTEAVRESQGWLWYVDQGIVDPSTLEPAVTVRREQVASEKQYWVKRVFPMFADEKFKPKPSYLCNYCPHGRAGGGGRCVF